MRPLLLALALMVAAPFPAALSPAQASQDDPAAVARGGRLYDDWLKELGEPPPEAAHPAWTGPTTDVATSWRCVSCHGYAYQGDRGQPGIAAMAGATPEAVVAALTAPRHGYGELLKPAELADLAAFVVAGQSHLMERIDPETRRLTGVDPGARAPLYQTICARCHGGDGQAVDTIPPLGELARSDPWRTLHNVLNGHSGGTMPALRALDEAVSLGTLAHLQTLPARERSAAIARGGRLYDDWIKETQAWPPTSVHPAWTGTKADAEDTWRCRDCHGTDYTGRGAAGVGIAGMAGAPDATVVGVLTDATHGYGAVLAPRDLDDLAAFVADGQMRMDWVIDASGRFPGDGSGYRAHYDMLCATCHGARGSDVRTMAPLGRVVHDEPARALHSVLNGHPGETMPPLRVFPEDLAAGILSYVQTLPETR